MKPDLSRADARVAEPEAVGFGIGTPRGLILIAAGLSLVASVGFYFTGDPQRGIFVGIWVPSILAFGSLILGGTDRE